MFSHRQNHAPSWRLIAMRLWSKSFLISISFSVFSSVTWGYWSMKSILITNILWLYAKHYHPDTPTCTPMLFLSQCVQSLSVCFEPRTTGGKERQHYVRKYNQLELTNLAHIIYIWVIYKCLKTKKWEGTMTTEHRWVMSKSGCGKKLSSPPRSNFVHRYISSPKRSGHDSPLFSFNALVESPGMV